MSRQFQFLPEKATEQVASKIQSPLYAPKKKRKEREKEPSREFAYQSDFGTLQWVVPAERQLYSQMSGLKQEGEGWSPLLWGLPSVPLPGVTCQIKCPDPAQKTVVIRHVIPFFFHRRISKQGCFCQESTEMWSFPCMNNCTSLGARRFVWGAFFVLLLFF